MFSMHVRNMQSAQVIKPCLQNTYLSLGVWFCIRWRSAETSTSSLNVCTSLSSVCATHVNLYHILCSTRESMATTAANCTIACTARMTRNFPIPPSVNDRQGVVRVG